MNGCRLLLVTATCALVVGCTPRLLTSAVSEVPEPLPASSEQGHQAVLLVSLNDGSIVSQTIPSGADYCFKANDSSETTCLTQGEPILDPGTNQVIAYEMIENRLHLYAN